MPDEKKSPLWSNKIEPGTELEEARELLRCCFKIEQFINGTMQYRAHIDDKYSDPISDEVI